MIFIQTHSTSVKGGVEGGNSEVSAGRVGVWVMGVSGVGVHSTQSSMQSTVESDWVEPSQAILLATIAMQSGIQLPDSDPDAP